MKTTNHFVIFKYGKRMDVLPVPAASIDRFIEEMPNIEFNGAGYIRVEITNSNHQATHTGTIRKGVVKLNKAVAA